MPAVWLCVCGDTFPCRALLVTARPCVCGHSADAQQLGFCLFCWRACALPGELLAIKEIAVPSAANKDIAVASSSSGSPHDVIFENLMKEVNMMRSLKHRHIVQYIGTSFKDNVLYLMLEYVPGTVSIPSTNRSCAPPPWLSFTVECRAVVLAAGGSLHSMLREFGPLQEDVIVHFTRQILLGLRYLHKKHIVHRDIKGVCVLPHSAMVFCVGVRRHGLDIVVCVVAGILLPSSRRCQHLDYDVWRCQACRLRLQQGAGPLGHAHLQHDGRELQAHSRNAAFHGTRRYFRRAVAALALVSSYCQFVVGGVVR